MTVSTALPRWGWIHFRYPIRRRVKRFCTGWHRAAEIPHAIERYREQTLPAVIQIPGVAGNTGAGVAGVKKSVEQAVGSDILFGEQ